MFLGRPLQEAILLAVVLGIICYKVAKYFINIANNIHGKRVRNLRFLLIHKQKDKIKDLINHLKEDENLRLIAKENIDIP